MTLKISVQVLILASLQWNVVARAAETSEGLRNSAVIAHGLPVLGSSNCTVGVVTSPVWGDKKLMFTAKHCVKDDSKDTAYASDAFSGITNSSKKAFTFSMSEGEFLPQQDLAVTEVQEVQNLKIHNLAKSFPKHGEFVTIYGYAMKVNIASMMTGIGYSPYQAHRCIYRGEYLTTGKPADVKQGASVMHLAECSESSASLRGASGSPILDERGDFVGVLSFQMTSRTVINDPLRSQENTVYAVFAGLSVEEYESRAKASSRGFKFVPVLEGPRSYPALNFFSLRETKVFGKNQQNAKVYVDLRRIPYNVNFRNDVLDGHADFTDEKGISGTEIWYEGFSSEKMRDEYYKNNNKKYQSDRTE